MQSLKGRGGGKLGVVPLVQWTRRGEMMTSASPTSSTSSTSIGSRSGYYFNPFGTRPLSTTAHDHQEAVWRSLGSHGREVLLNRPKALNALNLNMIRLLTPQYQAWKKDPAIKFVAMKGNGGKAFCAGGDIRAMYDEGVAAKAAGHNTVEPGSLREQFFKEEYILDYLIATLGKPHVAILNGITMGGGVGLSVHGAYRVGTEATTFAMPETAIGFFCDVGGSHFLPRVAPGFEVGMYLALTGARLKGYDVVRAGVATHYIHSSKLADFEKKLGTVGSPQQLDAVLQEFSTHEKDEKSDLVPHLDSIKKIFSKKTVEDIFIALEKDNSEWAKNTHSVLTKLSPTSLKVVFKQLHKGKDLPLDKCFEMEFRMSQAFMVGDEFYEGVRSVLVDKDKNPKWKPSKLEEVKDADVEAYFKPLADPAKELRLQ